MRRLVVASFALATLSVSAGAQGCESGSPAAADACAQGRDFFNYLAPQLGTSLTGGSHTLGIGTNLGGFPHFAIAVRVNGVLGERPTFDNITAGPAISKDLATKEQLLGLPTVDFALGITKGFNLGVTRIGGIDLIGGATYIPEYSDDDGFTLGPVDGSLSIGIGARVGLLEQSALLPGVSVSWMKRDLPTLDFTVNSGTGDVIAISDFSVKTTSWRISAQKNLLLFQLGAGFGSDTYDFSTVASASVDDGAAAGSFSAAQELTRTTMYGTLGINLLLFKVVGEVGQVSGGTVNTFNNFDTPADATRTYGTVGIRISF